MESSTVPGSDTPDPTPLNKLGLKYRDTVSGFEGILTANYIFLAGCIRCQLVRPIKADEKELTELVFDEEQIELVPTEAEALPTGRRSGGPMSSTPLGR